MKNAIILHGSPSQDEYYDPEMPSQSNTHWIAWLQGQLLKKDIETAAPEVPYSFEKNWEVWKKEVERFDIGPETILVGHSTGAGFFVKYLSINPHLRVKKMLLVAPFLDPFHAVKTDFYQNYDIDQDLKKRAGSITVFVSDDDAEDILESVQILEKNIKGLKVRHFQNYGHFTTGKMGTGKFPELLEEVLI